MAVIQARMSSTRLPGKTLRRIQGVPMLQLLVERLQPSPGGLEIVVATSRDSSDDAVEELCRELDVPCVRGDLRDVLARFVQVVERFEPELVVRLTGDNPLVDARAMDAGLRAFRETGDGTENAGVSNHLNDRTDPYGYAVEVLRPGALRRLHGSEATAAEREHVTLAFRRRDDLGSFEVLTGNQRDLRWTVDTDEDLRYVRSMFSELGRDCTAEEAVRWSRAHPHPSVRPGSDRMESEGPSVSFRPASEKDAERLLRWRNDPLTRKMAKTQHRIGREEHLEWLGSVLSSEDRMLWVAEDEGEPVGRFRVDYEDDRALLTWAVAPEHRHAGYGTAIVREGVQRVRQRGRGRQMVAEIKPQNHASRKIAKRAGLQFRGLKDGMEIWVEEISEDAPA